jgi:uncharacterized protein YbjQ (UPF0145 family)
MTVTTTPSVEGQKIVKYGGVVVGETIIGANIVKDIFAGITNIIGGRSSAYESSLREAREIAMREMIQEAENLGCNAIVGMDLDYETLGDGGNILMVTCSGTAVSIE